MSCQAEHCKEQRAKVKSLKKYLKEERASTNLLNLENHELNVELRKTKQECRNFEATNKSLESQMKTL